MKSFVNRRPGHTDRRYATSATKPRVGEGRAVGSTWERRNPAHRMRSRFSCSTQRRRRHLHRFWEAHSQTVVLFGNGDVSRVVVRVACLFSAPQLKLSSPNENTRFRARPVCCAGIESSCRRLAGLAGAYRAGAFGRHGDSAHMERYRKREVEGAVGVSGELDTDCFRQEDFPHASQQQRRHPQSALPVANRRQVVVFKFTVYLNKVWACCPCEVMDVFTAVVMCCCVIRISCAADFTSRRSDNPLFRYR